jgi:hypothetical protein
MKERTGKRVHSSSSWASSKQVTGQQVTTTWQQKRHRSSTRVMMLVVLGIGHTFTILAKRRTAAPRQIKESEQ